MRDLIARAARRAGIRRAVLAIALLLLAWSLVVAATGGLDTKVLGIRVSSRDAARSFWGAIVLVVLYVAAGWRQALDDLRWSRAHLDRAVPWVAAGALVVIGFVYATRTAAGADAYGYVSQADLWLNGQLTVHQPLSEELALPGRGWAFAPLGYRPGLRPHTIVPIYSPGLPMLMALAKLALGACGPFVVVPLAAGLLVYAAYLLGAAAAGRHAGLAACVLTACSPTLLHMSIWPMSDVPAAAAWTMALAFAMRSGTRAAIASGLFGAATILIRPNLVLLLAVVPVAMLIAGWREARAQALRRVLWFGVAAAPAVIFIAVLNAQLYGSPLRSGYGSTAALFSWQNLRPNTVRYGSWLLETQTLAILLAAVPLGLRTLPRGARTLLYGTVAVVALSYLFYEPWDAWWYLRFLLPAFPALLVLTVIGGGALLGRVWRRGALALGAIAVAMLSWFGIARAHEEGSLRMWRTEARYQAVGRYVQEHTPPNAVMLSMQHSGSVRYYGGRRSMRYDQVRDLDATVRALLAHGYHPYVLLDQSEREKFFERFAGTSELGRLDWLPVAQLQTAQHVTLYDVVARDNTQSPARIAIRAPECAASPERVVP